MSFWAVIFVVLMVIWLVFGFYSAPTGDNKFPVLMGTTLIPWACVAILGTILLGGLPR